MTRWNDERASAARPLTRGKAGMLTLGLLLAVMAGIGLFALIGTPLGHSYGFNMGWTVGFSAALDDGAIYPRHLPALWGGLGGLDFLFYGPLPYYVAAGPARLLCPECSPQVVFGLTGGLLWALSGLSFLIFAWRLLPAGPALVAAVFWAMMPYHLGIDWVVRQAAGEYAAYVFLPLVGHGMAVAMQDHRMGWSLPVGLAGLALCHLPTLVLAAHILAPVVLLWAIAHPSGALKVLPQLAAMAAAGMAMAAIYWLPALVLLGDVSPEGLYTEDLTPSAWYLLGPGVLPDTMYKAAILACQLAALAAAGAAVLLAGGQRRQRLLVWALLPAALVVALNTSLTAPLWENWIISRVQFPFRLTVFSDWAAALAAGTLVAAALKPGSWRRRGLGAAGLAAILVSALAVGALLPKRIADGVAARGTAVAPIGAPEYLPPPLFAPLKNRIEAEGLPIWDLPWKVMDLSRTVMDPASGVLRPEMPGPRRWTVTLPAETGAGPVRIALPYWRYLVAETATGDPLPLRPDPASGLVVLDPATLAPDDMIRIRLPWHWSETAGLILSVLGLLGTVACILAGRRSLRA